MTRSADRKKTKRSTGKKAPAKRTRRASKASSLGVAPLIPPSSDALSRYEAIPLLFGSAANAKRQHGRVVFDSWAQGPAIALRDVTEGHVRRLRLKAGKLSLEILAEKHREQWEFVARVYRGQQVAHDCVLKVGGRSLPAAWGGYFHWSSKHVPAKVDVLSYDREFIFGKLVWR